MVWIWIIVAVVAVAWLGWWLTRLSRRGEPVAVELTDEFRAMLDLLHKTRKSVFITGQAGTGKSTLMRLFMRQTRKKYVVLASTGVAALNVGGQTIHSFFHFGKDIEVAHIKPDYLRATLFQSLDMVIIDEVSMVRADLMDCIDKALRLNRNKPDEPFGGVQLVMVGDLFQLPPVMAGKNEERVRREYATEYFFSAHVFDKFRYEKRELTHVFRQAADQARFKEILNDIRVGRQTFQDMVDINARHKTYVATRPDAIVLTSKRSIADAINNERLDAINGAATSFAAKADGTVKLDLDKAESDDKRERMVPAPLALALKVGARVIMLRNDSARRWVNGSLGTITAIGIDEVTVSIDGGGSHVIRPETWEEVEYVADRDGNITKRVTGSYTQLPMQLAYAITIHKSQGKTFDNITIDIGSGAFSHGQVYVAMSRCTSLEGITLNSEVRDADIIVDKRVVAYYDSFGNPTQPQPQSQPKPATDCRKAIADAVAHGKPLRIKYVKKDGEASERTLDNITYSDKDGNPLPAGSPRDYIHGRCRLRNEERTFKIARISEAVVEMK